MKRSRPNRLLPLAFLALALAAPSCVDDSVGSVPGNPDAGPGVVVDGSGGIVAAPGVTVTPTGGLTTSEGGGTATFTVVLQSQPNADVTIALSSSNTAEGTVGPAGLTFTTASWAAPQTVTVTGVDDAEADGPVTYSIVTGATASADPRYSGIEVPDVTVSNTDNDTAGVTVTPTAGLVTTEAGGSATFSVVLNAEPADDVTIALSSSNTNEGTVSPVSVVFTKDNWTAPQIVTVTGVGDALPDGPGLYKVVTAPAASSDAAYDGLDADDVSVSNTDNDSAGITVTPTSGLTTSEAGGTATFTIVLNAQPFADVSIAVASDNTNEGTVSPAGVVFTDQNWSAPQEITVTGVDDALLDGAVAFIIVTSAAVSTDPAYSGIDPADVGVTNTDNDTAGVTVSPTSGLSTTEGGGTATFSVVLNAAPAADVTIGLTSSDTTEGTVSPTSVTFTAVNWRSPVSVTVTGVNDAVQDGNVPYSIVTAAVVSTDANYSGINPSDVSLINVDNDSAGVTVSPTSGLTTTEAGGSAVFTIVLNSQPAANVTFALSSNDTTEGTVSPASVTFTGANWNAPVPVTVTGVNDLVADGNVPYSIITGAAVSTDVKYAGINPPDVGVTNTDNDSAGITVTPVAGLTTTEAGGTATFTVVLNSQPTAGVTLGLTSSDTTEGTVSPPSASFTTLNWNGPITVTVTGVNDLVADGNVPYAIVTAAAVSADLKYNGINPPNVAVTNTDNDSAGITVTPVSGLATTEAGGTAGFTIVLNSQPTQDVTIGLTSSDATEGTVSPASVTFTTVNWNAPAPVTVTGVNDAVQDGNIPYKIVTAAATSADATYAGLNPSDVSLTNTDNDSAGITVSPTSGLVTTEAGGTAQFTIVLNSQPTANVTIGLTSSDTTEGTVAASVTFTSANWNVAQPAVVTGVNDAVQDGNIPYTIVTAAATSTDANYSGVNPPDVTASNLDNDTAGFIVGAISGHTTEYGGKATFNVQLTSQPTGNVSLAVSSTDTTEGTVSPASLTFTSANWNVAQPVTVTGVFDILADGNQVFTVVLAAATSGDPNYSGLNPPDVSVTNDDVQIWIASVGMGGVAANGASFNGVTSANGDVVAFNSLASNLVPNDTNGVADVFVRVISTGVTTRVSVSSAGVQSNGASVKPSISGDGRFVAFQSAATNLDPGDTTATDDVYLYDRTTGALTLLSAGKAGSNASVDGTGSRIAFQSIGQLTRTDTNGLIDIYVYDVAAGAAGRVSLSSAGAQADGACQNPSIASDGTLVTYDSAATNLTGGDTNAVSDVFLRDIGAGTTTRLSQTGVAAIIQGNGASTQPAMSSDGTSVVFQTVATNLAAGDTNGVQDIYAHTAALSLVRYSINGATQSTALTGWSNVSGTGAYAVFHGDDGGFVAGDTNGVRDIFLRTVAGGTIKQLTLGNGASAIPWISSDARFVVFESLATNLGVPDTNAFSDIYMMLRP